MISGHCSECYAPLSATEVFFYGSMCARCRLAEEHGEKVISMHSYVLAKHSEDPPDERE